MSPINTTGTLKPALNIPHSAQTVDVRVIDSTARIKIPTAAFIQDRILGHDFLECPAYSFLVEHSSGEKVLFDLGVRKDIDGFSPVILERINHIMALNGAMSVESDIATILGRGEDGIELEKINAIIWSHWHMDHSGDPSTFPSSTALIVGPGFKEALLPGYPADPRGRIRETDYEGRELREINFDAHPSSLKIGKFRAFDYFGDGSFYLLDSPGHTVGHMCALARTTPSTFIFMGGDACHHCGSFRPTEYIPLPEELSPSPLSSPPHAPGSVCPGSLLEDIHPHRSKTIPFYKNLSPAPDRNVSAAEETISKMTDFDADDNVFVVIAHDTSLLGVMDFYPKKANQWQKKGWKKAGQWRFLEDFRDVVQAL